MFDPVTEQARKIHLKKKEEEAEQEEEREEGEEIVETEKLSAGYKGMSWRKKAAAYYWHKRFGRRKK